MDRKWWLEKPQEAFVFWFDEVPIASIDNPTANTILINHQKKKKKKKKKKSSLSAYYYSVCNLKVVNGRVGPAQPIFTWPMGIMDY